MRMADRESRTFLRKRVLPVFSFAEDRCRGRIAARSERQSTCKDTGKRCLETFPGECRKVRRKICAWRMHPMGPARVRRQRGDWVFLRSYFTGGPAFPCDGGAVGDDWKSEGNVQSRDDRRGNRSPSRGVAGSGALHQHGVGCGGFLVAAVAASHSWAPGCSIANCVLV